MENLSRLYFREISEVWEIFKKPQDELFFLFKKEFLYSVPKFWSSLFTTDPVCAVNQDAFGDVVSEMHWGIEISVLVHILIFFVRKLFCVNGALVVPKDCQRDFVHDFVRWQSWFEFLWHWLITTLQHHGLPLGWCYIVMNSRFIQGD